MKHEQVLRYLNTRQLLMVAWNRQLGVLVWDSMATGSSLSSAAVERTATPLTAVRFSVPPPSCDSLKRSSALQHLINTLTSGLQSLGYGPEVAFLDTSPGLLCSLVLLL